MERISDILRKITGGKKAESFVATVEKVNGRTCDVQPVDEAPLKSVRLNAIISDEVGIVITPIKGSAVLVTKLSEVDSFVSLFSAIEKVELVIGKTRVIMEDSEMRIIIGGAEVKISDNKFSIKNSAYTLKQAWNELIAELKAAIITTPSGPGNKALL